ncbi:MAG: threonine ammonia-lyase [Gaiellaceae bacterium]
MTTPLERAPDALVERVGLRASLELCLKREDDHELGAFKWRGALPTVEGYRSSGASSVVTASTGNHGAAVAWACKQLGLDCVVYGPEHCSQAKLDLIRAQGAETVLVGTDLDEAKEAARAVAANEGHAFFEDGVESAQFAGYGQIALELVEQLDVLPAAVVVPLGNGALLIGVGRALRRISPETELIAVVAKDAPVMARSVAAKEPVEETGCETFADGLAVRVAIPSAVDAIVALDCRLLEVSERDLARAVGDYNSVGLRVEGSAAAALAAAREVRCAGPLVLLVTGSNIDDTLHRRAVEEPTSFPD